MRLFILAGLILIMLQGNGFSAESKAELVLKAERIQSLQLVDLGQIQVPPLGLIRFSGKKDGNQIIVKALGSDGSVVGRAETVSGLNETPIYINSPQGLKKIILKWEDPK